MNAGRLSKNRKRMKHILLLSVIYALTIQPLLANEHSLIDILTQQKDALKRESALIILGKMKNPLAIKAILRTFKEDKNQWVRARAAEALGKMRAKIAINALTEGLKKEKNQSVRRKIAIALMKLGEKKGLLELMWQLQYQPNFAKAEVMKALVDIFRMPIGQDINAWWTFFAKRGYAQLEEIKNEKRMTALKSAFQIKEVLTSVCITELKFEHLGRLPITKERLIEALEKQPIEDGCLIAIVTKWKESPPPTLKLADIKPGLSFEAYNELKERYPNFKGIIIDTDAIDLKGPTTPVKDALNANKKYLFYGAVKNSNRKRVLLLREKDREVSIYRIH